MYKQFLRWPHWWWRNDPRPSPLWTWADRKLVMVTITHEMWATRERVGGRAPSVSIEQIEDWARRVELLLSGSRARLEELREFVMSGTHKRRREKRNVQ